MRAFILAVTGLVFAAAAACSSYGTSVVEVEKTQAQVASVSLTVPASLVAGQTARAIATPKDASGKTLTDRAVTWHTSSATIASVSDSGVISAVAPGTAVVSAVSEGVAGQASMAVVPPPPTPIATLAIVLNPAAVLIGQTAQATATPLDSSGNQLSGRLVTWESSDITVATVQATGLVKAVGTGAALIKASSEGKSNSSRLSVSAPAPIPVASISLSPATASLAVAGTVQLSAVTRDANGNVLTGRAIVWNSSNTAVGTVSASGLVSAVAAGNATISGSSEGQVGTATVTVNPPAPVPVASVSISPATSTIQAGSTAQLSAVTRDASNNVLTGRSISWSSGNTAIATVSASGLVTAVAAGSATITASSEGKSATSALTVTAPPAIPVASVSVSPATTSVQAGTTVQLAAVVRDASNNLLTGRAVTWSSADPAIASVNSTSGLVTGLAVGSVSITATSEGKSGTATVTVTAVPPPPPPSGLWRANEPAGMTQLGSRPFNALTEDNWKIVAASGSISNFSIVSDGTAPRSPSNVGRVRFPAGFVGGGEPVNVYKDGVQKTRVRYWSFYFKLSDGWQSQPSAGSKIMHIFVNGVNRMFLHARGFDTTDPIYPWIGLQQLAGSYNAPAQGGEAIGTACWLKPNQPGQTGVQLIRGQWILMEGLVDAGTPGGANGTAKWWINGVLVGSYTGIPFVAAGGSATWEDWQWAPTWGGGGGTIAKEQYQYLDEIYFSGK